jgi:NADH dehydrogenase [ubiquinone] 1 alpha subcomplex assembly factor 5
MRSADAVTGAASAHVHPRIEASALAPLLSNAGFAMPIVDVDRVSVAYPSFERLVRDLRAMGATNLLYDRSKQPLSRAAYRAALDAFAMESDAGRTTETFEILHFAAWKKSRANE